MKGEKARLWRSIAMVWQDAGDTYRDYKNRYKQMKKTYTRSKNPSEYLKANVTMAQYEYNAKRQRLYEAALKEHNERMQREQEADATVEEADVEVQAAESGEA